MVKKEVSAQGGGLKSTKFNLPHFLSYLVLSYMGLCTGRVLGLMHTDLSAYWK